MLHPYLIEIEKILASCALSDSPWRPESYIGGGQSKLRYLGLRVPDLHLTLKRGFSFSGMQVAEQARIWDEIWRNSDCFEVMALALSWFYHPKQEAHLKKHWPLLKKWSARIDNWAHSDSLSGIYARILEESPSTVYPTLVQWNRSKNPWLRRLSIVSLMYYSSQRDKVLPLSKILPLVDAQLEFDHYYVQKGVGWTLREAGNVYPKETFRYLEKNIGILSAHAFSAATEKISPKQKAFLKKLRQERRAK